MAFARAYAMHTTPSPSRNRDGAIFEQCNVWYIIFFCVDDDIKSILYTQFFVNVFRAGRTAEGKHEDTYLPRVGLVSYPIRCCCCPVAREPLLWGELMRPSISSSISHFCETICDSATQMSIKSNSRFGHFWKQSLEINLIRRVSACRCNKMRIASVCHLHTFHYVNLNGFLMLCHLQCICSSQRKELPRPRTCECILHTRGRVFRFVVLWPMLLFSTLHQSFSQFNSRRKCIISPNENR